MLATPPNLFIDQTVTLDQDPAHKEVYTYTKADAGPNELANVEVNAPFDTTYNLINIQGNDDGGASHEADALFEPSRPPPFSQEVELFSYDYPEPGSVIAQISP